MNIESILWGVKSWREEKNRMEKRKKQEEVS